MGNFPEQEKKIVQSLAQTNKTPAQVVEELIALTTSVSKDPNGKVGDHCYNTADAFRDLAENTEPSKQEKLVSFYNLLRKESINTPSGEPLTKDDEKVWQDMPSFGYALGDEVASYYPGQEFVNQRSQRLENLIAFLAQLDAFVDDSEPHIDFAKGWARQHTAYLSGEHKDEGNKEEEEEETRELSIRIACMWYIYDADKMWRKVPEADGYSLTQWQKRRDGLIEARTAKVSEDTLELVEKALSNIVRVDGETWAMEGTKKN